jgi:hypothetical protein
MVTTESVLDELLPALANMHEQLAASGIKWATKLEGAYISKQAIRRYEPEKTTCAWLGSDRHFAVEPLGNGWVIRPLDNHPNGRNYLRRFRRAS